MLHKISAADEYERIISLENLLAAWKEFKRGKTRKQDVQEFDAALEENLFEIRDALKSKDLSSRAVCFVFCFRPEAAQYPQSMRPGQGCASGSFLRPLLGF